MNCDALGVGVPDTAPEVGFAAADDALEEADETAEAIAEETAAAALDAAEALDEAAEAAAEVALATAEETAPEALGISMGTPASLQVFWTAAMVEAWSVAEHAPWTQGCTVARRLAPFWQWHLKSVRAEQPSLVRGPTRQAKAHCGMLSSWAEATEAKAMTEAIAKVFIVNVAW